MRPFASRLIVLTPLNTLLLRGTGGQLATGATLKPTLVHIYPLHATLRHYMHRHKRAQVLFALFQHLKRLKLQGKLPNLEKTDEVNRQTKYLSAS